MPAPPPPEAFAPPAASGSGASWAWSDEEGEDDDEETSESSSWGADAQHGPRRVGSGGSAEELIVRLLRDEFEQPDDVLRHVFRSSGSYAAARSRLRRQVEQELTTHDASEEAAGWSFIVAQLRRVTLASLVGYPIFRAAFMQQLHGCTVCDASRSIVDAGVASAFHGTVAYVIQLLAQWALRNRMWDVAFEYLTPEEGWTAAHDTDIVAVAHITTVVSSVACNALLYPLRVCAVREAAAPSPSIFCARAYTAPFADSSHWGYFKGLGSLLVSRTLVLTLKQWVSPDRTAGSRRQRLARCLQACLAFPLVHLCDTLSTLMAVHGAVYPTALHLVIDDSSPLYDRPGPSWATLPLASLGKYILELL